MSRCVGVCVSMCVYLCLCSCIAQFSDLAISKLIYAQIRTVMLMKDLFPLELYG